MKECLKEWFPEIGGVFAFLVGATLAFFGKFEIALPLLSNFASVITQVLATYTGLVLTAYAVFHSMRINSQSYLTTKNGMTSDKLTAINGFVDDIHTIFIQSIVILCGSTVLSAFIYLLTLADGYSTSLTPEAASEINAAAASLLFGGLVTGTLNIAGAIKCLFDLRGQ